MELASILSWSIALVPVLGMTAAFIWLDVFKLMTFGETMVLLLIGGLVALATFPLSGAFLDTLPIGFNFYSRFIAPWIEEAMKGLVIVGLYMFNRIGLKLDAIISGFAVGAGFAVVENTIYLLRHPELSHGVWLVRGLGTAIMHGATLAMLAAITHQIADRSLHVATRDFRLNPLWFVPGFLVAVAIHLLFNQFAGNPMLAMLGTFLLAPLSLMTISRYGTRQAEKWLLEEQKMHSDLVTTLHAGRFPEDQAWQRIAALAERAGPEAAGKIREYVTVLSELVLAEENSLIDEASGQSPDRQSIPAKLKRYAELSAELGPATVTALASLLPFSRNDYWELSELRSAVARGVYDKES